MGQRKKFARYSDRRQLGLCALSKRKYLKFLKLIVVALTFLSFVFNIDYCLVQNFGQIQSHDITPLLVFLSYILISIPQLGMLVPVHDRQVSKSSQRGRQS